MSGITFTIGEDVAPAGLGNTQYRRSQTQGKVVQESGATITFKVPLFG